MPSLVIEVRIAPSLRRGAVRRLGLGEPVAFGPLLGPVLLLLYWATAPPPA